MILRKSTLFFALIAAWLILNPADSFAQTDPLTLNVSSAMGETGTRVCLDVTAENFNNVESIQFNLSYNATLVVPECPATYVHPLLANNIFGDIFNCNNKDNGYINFVWASDPTTIPDGEIIFTICFNIIGDPGNKSPVYFNGLILDIEVCKLGQNGISECTEELGSNVGTIMIISNTLQIFYNKCDADGVNNIENASLTFYATGGTPPYTYSINGGTYTGVINNDGERVTISNIPQTTYTIQITDSNLLVTTAGPITVSNSLPITFDTPIVKSPTCADRKNGLIELPNVDGVTPLRYEWSNLVSGGAGYNKISDLQVGTYTVTITDFGGCKKSETFTLSLDTLKMNAIITRDASCSQVKDGRVEISVTGGTPWKMGQPYEFSLNGNNWIRFTSPHIINNLGTGNFTLNVRDSLFCDTDVKVLFMPVDRIVEMSVAVKDATCYGVKDAEIELTASPYSVNYTYLPIIGFPDLGIIKTDTLKAGNLGAGNYGYRVIDAAGCKDTLFFTILQPDSLKLNPVIKQPDCTSAGTITLNPTGGTGNFSFNWNPAQPGNTNEISGLDGGNYTVTVTDENNCATSSTFLLNTSGTLNISVTSENVTCAGLNNGRATVSAIFSGQIQMIEIFWMDANGMALPFKTSTIQNLPPGSYSVEVIAADGCKSLPKSFVITEPAPLTLMTTVSNALCNNFNGKAVVSFGTDPTGFIYEWRLKGSSVVIDSDNTLDAKAGTYTIKVISPANCVSETEITITEPPVITFPTPETRNVTCFGLSTGQAAVINAPAGLTFNWSTGSTGAFAVNFPAGPGWVFANNNQNCKSDTVFFNIGTFPPISIDGSLTQVVNPVCYGDANGSVTIAATGGTSIGYKYIWANGTIGPTLNNVQAGAYIVTISDSNNCMQADTFYLTQPDKLEAIIDRTKTIELDCNNQDGGKIGLLTTGGNPGKKTFTWQSGLTIDNDVAIGLSSGTYCATVSDNFGCKDTICYTLTAPEPLKGELNTPVEPLCNGGTTCISVNFLTGGTGNKYTFQINNGTRYPIDSCVTVFAGQYFINLIDSAGCSIDTIINIDQPEPISVDLGPDRDVQLGLPSPVINAIIGSTAGLDTLIWTPFLDINCLNSTCTSIETSPAVTTSYLLTVTDLNGCSGTDEIIVNVKNTRNVFFANIFTPNRDGNNDYFQAVIGPGVEKVLSFVIFDRWGNQIFSKSDFFPDPAGTDGWDGTFNGRRLDPGVFVYYSKVRFIDQKEVEYSGSVTLADKVRN